MTGLIAGVPVPGISALKAQRGLLAAVAERGMVAGRPQRAFIVGESIVSVGPQIPIKLVDDQGNLILDDQGNFIILG